MAGANKYLRKFQTVSLSLVQSNYLTSLFKNALGLLRIREAFPVFSDNMDFDSLNQTYTSPPRRERRQNQTYCTPSSYPKHSNDDGEPLLESAKTQSSAQSSTRLARGINLNLLSRISKFEALDALSMPIKLQYLRPAHLRLSRKSSTFKGMETSHKKMLSTIFSPSSESRKQYAKIEDGFTSEQDTPAMPKSRKWFSPKKVDPKKLRRSEVSYNSAKVKMRDGVLEKTEASELKGTDTVAFEDMLNEAPARKKTIRDMIKLYDGSSDKAVSKAPSKGKTAGSPRVPIAAQATHPSQIRTSYVKPSPGASTASPKSKLNTKQNVDTTTPTKPRQFFAAKQRQLRNGPQTPISTVNSKPSPSRSSISVVSHRTEIRTRKSKLDVRAKSERSPVRISLNRRASGSNKPQQPSLGAGHKAGATEERGRAFITPADKESAQLSPEHLKVNGKIEELYRAKSLERNQENLREFSALQDTPSAKARTLPHANVTQQQTDVEEGKRRTLSKVAAMRQIFEGVSPPQLPVSVALPSQPKPLFSNISPFSNDRKAMSKAAASPPQRPVFLPPSDFERSVNVSLKTVQKPLTDRKGSERLLQDASKIPPPLATTRKQRTNGPGTIRDKIKLFENREEAKKPDCEKKSSYACRIRKSVQSLFERKSDEVDEIGLDSQEVKDIMNEFQDNELLLPKTLKRNAFSGTWKIFAEGAPSNITDGTMSEKGIGSPVGDGLTVMIVKEAECGLKQPKPVRVTEMKRMMLLCRERVGSIIDKEKGRAAQQSTKL